MFSRFGKYFFQIEIPGSYIQPLEGISLVPGVMKSEIESGRWSRVEISIDECRLLIVEVSEGDAARERRKTSTINNRSSAISNQRDEYYNSTFNHTLSCPRSVEFLDP